MARRRRPGFAGIIILLLAAGYWFRQQVGVSEDTSVTGELNKISQAGFALLPWAIGIVVAIVVWRMLVRGSEPESQDKNK